jgi:hypothetical protein
MKEFYDLIDKIYEELNSNDFVNTVTFGNIMDVDLAKQSIFPLSHINIQDAVFGEHTITFSIQVIAMDLVDESKEDKFDTDSIPYQGLDNKHDVLNTQLAVINRLQSKLRRGDLNDDNYVLDTDATATMFEDRFENLMTGWALTLSISIPNNVVTVC